MKNGVPVRAGEMRELLIERLGSHAEGVARAEGFTVFVPGALPGEKVLARVDTVKKNYAAATLKEIRQATSLTSLIAASLSISITLRSQSKKASSP